MNKIAYAVGNALMALYLAAGSPAYADGASANSRVEKIEAKVHQASPGIESIIDGATIQHGFFRGIYRVDADLTLRNSQDALAGPLTLTYSLCFTDGKSSGCIDGKSEQLLSGLSKGEMRKKLPLKQRFPFKEIELETGKKVPLSQLKPKITIQLKREGQILSVTDHYLPPVQEYKCKDYCPG